MAKGFKEFYALEIPRKRAEKKFLKSLKRPLPTFSRSVPVRESNLVVVLKRVVVML